MDFCPSLTQAEGQMNTTIGSLCCETCHEGVSVLDLINNPLKTLTMQPKVQICRISYLIKTCNAEMPSQPMPEHAPAREIKLIVDISDGIQDVHHLSHNICAGKSMKENLL